LQISKLFQTIHNRSAELTVAKSELEILHAGCAALCARLEQVGSLWEAFCACLLDFPPFILIVYIKLMLRKHLWPYFPTLRISILVFPRYAKQLNAKEGAWQSALDSARAETAEAAVSSSCEGTEEEHKVALEALRSQYEDQLLAKVGTPLPLLASGGWNLHLRHWRTSHQNLMSFAIFFFQEEAWGSALERAEAQLRAHSASASTSRGVGMSGGVSGGTSGDLSGASDDRVTAAELAAMRQVAKDLAFKPTYARACASRRTCSIR
jgi:hypothetical protein